MAFCVGHFSCFVVTLFLCLLVALVGFVENFMLSLLVVYYHSVGRGT